MQAVILTGIVAGFVHVVSGADHLIAMVPAAINNPQKALKNSFSWGLGHSSGVILLAFLAIFIKDITPLNKFSSCLLYTSPSPRDGRISRMPSSA